MTLGGLELAKLLQELASRHGGWFPRRWANGRGSSSQPGAVTGSPVLPTPSVSNLDRET